MSRSASKIRDIRSSAQKDMASFKNRRSVSVDTRSRGSYVPEKKRPSSEERKSGNTGYNRWSGARKSSINISETTKRRDTRPLSDKAYQEKKICDLVKFLEESGFKYPISVGKLMSPSKKEFEIIFQYLYNCFDPTYKVKKVEEEAPKILKNLGYPFTINKSAFVYVARTNWPSLLGALIWLMDLNTFALQVDMKHLFESGEDADRAEIHSILLRYICQCHHSGIDDEEQENSMFIHIIKSSMKDLDALFAENEEKKLLLESVEKELNEIKRLSEQKESFEKSIEKYEEYIAKMKSHHEKTNESYEKLLAELKEKELELNSLQGEVSKQQDLYDAQGFDGKKQLNYFESQKKELTEKLDRKKSDFRELQDKFWEAEIQFKQNLDKVTAALESFNEIYNARIEEARVILHPLQSMKNPQIQKLCNSYHMDFPSWEILPSKPQPNWNIIQKNALESILDKLRNTDELFKRVSTSQNEKLSEIQTKKSDLSVQLKLLLVKENHLESDINLKGKQAVDEIASLEAQCEKISESIKNLQTERSNLEVIYRKMTEELKYLVAFEENMQKDLKAYLVEQRSLFELFLKDEGKVVELVSTYGKEIFQGLKDLKKLKD